jgi:hypothetical protein
VVELIRLALAQLQKMSGIIDIYQRGINCVRQKQPEVPKNLRRSSERELRMKLNRLIKSGDGMIKATLADRERVCGKANCICTCGEKHKSLYLVQRQDGQTRQLFVPAAWDEAVRQWACNYQVMQQLLNELSEIYWQKIQKREI